MEYQVLFLEQKTTDERGSLMNMTNDQTEIRKYVIIRICQQLYFSDTLFS